MQLEALKHLDDMRRACRLLAEFVTGKTFADDSTDALLRSAVERQLTIVGEALNRLKKIDPAAASSITDARQIIAFRNILGPWLRCREGLGGLGHPRDRPIRIDPGRRCATLAGQGRRGR